MPDSQFCQNALGRDFNGSREKAVNEPEAQLVRRIFELYLKHKALLPVVRELANLGWLNKRWRNLLATLPV